MLIALDYDGTYTADPDLWDAFIANAKKNGHEVICVTMRHAHEAVDDFGVQVIYTGRQPKFQYMKALGRSPNIWIDDQPFYLFQGG